MPNRNVLIAEELTELSAQLQRTFLVEIFATFSDCGISLTQYNVLGILNQGDGMNMTQLANYMRHTQSTTTGIIMRLSQARLVKCSPNPDDRRQSIIRITELGRDMLEKIKRGVVRNIKDIFQEMTQEDIEAWVRVYRAMKANAQGFPARQSRWNKRLTPACVDPVEVTQGA